MITNDNSWSLGASPNKSLDSSPQPVGVGVNIEPFIPIHLPGGPLNFPRTHCVPRPCAPTAHRPIKSIPVHPCPFVSSPYRFDRPIAQSPKSPNRLSAIPISLPQTHSVYKKTHSTRHTQKPRITLFGARLPVLCVPYILYVLSFHQPPSQSTRASATIPNHPITQIPNQVIPNP
jgi:hypothetical protein